MYLFFHYISIIGFAFSIYCFVIALSNGEKVLSMTFLFLSNVILVLISVFYFLFISGKLFDYSYFIGLHAPFYYLVGPTTYFFVRTLFYKETKLRRWDLLHFIPFILSFVELIPFYLQDTSTKMEIITVMQKDNSIPFLFFEGGLLPSKFHTYLKIISWVGYSLLSLKIFLYFKKTIKTNIITDYNRKFNFINYYLLTKYIGIIFFTTVLYINYNQSLIVIPLIGNAIGISNIFIMILLFPDFLYGEKNFVSNKDNRESLMKIVKTQTENLSFLENSKYEANVLFDLNFEVMYFNKLAEAYFKKAYNYSLQLNESVLDHLDRLSADKLKKYFNGAIRGESYKIEEKFLLYEEKIFSWMELNFEPQYSGSKLIGVSVGVNLIDTKKKMEELQVKYNKTLDELVWDSSHLLRSPVANIIGVLNILEDKEVKITEIEKDFFFRNIRFENNKLDITIKEMVTKAREQIEK